MPIKYGRLANVPVYRTDENGTIIMTSDGNNINFSCNPGTHNGKKENSTTSSSNSSKPGTNTTTTPNNKGPMVWKSPQVKNIILFKIVVKWTSKMLRKLLLKQRGYYNRRQLLLYILFVGFWYLSIMICSALMSMKTLRR